jgi:hypothetical protein
MDSEASFLPNCFLHKCQKFYTFPPKESEITNKTLLAPCKILFSFLLQAYKYAKFQNLCKDGWTQAMTKVYLCTSCMSGDASDKFFSMANNVKQNNAPETIVTPPVLILQHKVLGIKIEHFQML